MSEVVEFIPGYGKAFTPKSLMASSTLPERSTVQSYECKSVAL